MTTTRVSLADRFWPKVDVRGVDDCWEWRAAVAPEGYGAIGRGGRCGGRLQAHRVSWELHKGEIPPGACVLHRCDNRVCVNPRHLFLGTRQDNLLDMTAKGRRWSKITVEQAQAIFAAVGPARLVAKRFGVCRSTVSHIRNGRNWKTATHQETN